MAYDQCLCFVESKRFHKFLQQSFKIDISIALIQRQHLDEKNWGLFKVPSGHRSQTFKPIPNKSKH